MDPPCCFSAVLFHEVKSEDHFEKTKGHVLNGKYKELQKIDDSVRSDWLASDWIKLYFPGIENTKTLDCKSVSKSQQQA